MANGKTITLTQDQIEKLVKWHTEQKSVAASCRDLDIQPPALYRPMRTGYISQKLYDKIKPIFE